MVQAMSPAPSAAFSEPLPSCATPVPPEPRRPQWSDCPGRRVDGSWCRARASDDGTRDPGARPDWGPAARVESASLDAFVRAHYPRLVRLAGLITRDADQAQDAVQSALERAWRKRRPGSGQSAIVARSHCCPRGDPTDPRHRPDGSAAARACRLGPIPLTTRPSTPASSSTACRAALVVRRQAHRSVGARRGPRRIMML